VFNPRPGQTEVINFTSGKMGVSAVPGSGKTHTLSFLAANLVASDLLQQYQEVLIVTLVNSAVDIFSSRVAGFLSEMGLIPGVGYRVRTLHGLAYDIVREHPDRIGLDNHFSIIDERTAMDILDLFVRNWMQENQSILETYTHEEFQFDTKIRQWRDFLKNLAANFIKKAKDFQLSPQNIRQMAKETEIKFPFLYFACEIYENYQQALQQRGSVDFEDLIRYAYQLLNNDEEYKKRLQTRWPVILEDEAQDSSLIQEKLLRLLCGNDGNWVRVGDPNQAIFETFTTADPELLRSFLEETDVRKIDLKHSGRSMQSIINLANHLIQWAIKDHPVTDLRSALTIPLIQPTPPGDPQQNPIDEPDQIFLIASDYKPEKELQIITRSLKKWIAENGDKTVAVLIPRNTRGAELAEELEKHGVPFIERLRSSKSTRDVASVLANILDFLVKPNIIRKMNSAVWSVLKAIKVDFKDEKDSRVSINALLKYFSPEIFLGTNPLPWESYAVEHESDILNTLKQAQSLLQKWQFAASLPVDQLIMTISMDLFTEPTDLALAHKLAVQMELQATINTSWELSNFQEQLSQIARNQLNLFGFSDEDMAFNPDLYPGKVLITTYHKAKGLEWDRVYLMSVNNYNFPSGQEYDSYLSERWFVRDELNLEAELISYLEYINSGAQRSSRLIEGEASREARMDYCAERLRLLYVGITRARKELVVTWNTGKRGNCVEALPLQELRNWQENANGH